MPDEIQNTINEQLQTLPPEIAQAIKSIDWATKINEIGQKYALHIDQLGILENEIVLVLIGLVNPDDFANQIRSRINLPEDKILQIEQDATSLIFAPVRQNLIDIYDEELKDDQSEEKEVVEKKEQPNIITDKMAGSFSLPKQTSDHSLSRESVEKGSIEHTNLPETAPTADMYREPIN